MNKRRIIHAFDAGRPAALEAAGLARGFHAWRGKSGRRYLTTVHDARHAPAYGDGAIVVLARPEADGTRVAVWAGLSGVVGVALLMGAVPAPDRFLVGVLVAQAALAAAVWRLWGRGHASRAWEALVGLVLTAIVASWLLVPEAALVRLPDGVRWPLELGQYLVAPLSLVILLAAQPITCAACWSIQSPPLAALGAAGCLTP